MKWITVRICLLNLFFDNIFFWNNIKIRNHLTISLACISSSYQLSNRFVDLELVLQTLTPFWWLILKSPIPAIHFNESFCVPSRRKASIQNSKIFYALEKRYINMYKIRNFTKCIWINASWNIVQNYYMNLHIHIFSLKYWHYNI